MSNFPDHFSVQARAYAEFRPVYPPELFTWLTSLCADHELCWDVATGNGQAAEALSPFFNSVFASDASEKQIAEAKVNPRIRYAVEPAEKTPLPDGSCDLVTVAQAIHWFKHDAFYQEVRRVSKPKGVLAVWGYGSDSIEPEIDSIVNYYYAAIVGEYWPPERKHIENELKSIPFPFQEIKAPLLTIEDNYSLKQFKGYLESWSSTQRYIQARGENPLALIEKDLAKAWGSVETRKIRWPLFFKVAKI